MHSLHQHDCRTPFAHDADTCDCEPDRISITLRNSNLNAKARAEADSFARTAFLLTIIGMAAFSACFAGAAIVDRANSNINQWVAENEPV